MLELELELEPELELVSELLHGSDWPCRVRRFPSRLDRAWPQTLRHRHPPGHTSGTTVSCRGSDPAILYHHTRCQAQVRAMSVSAWLRDEIQMDQAAAGRHMIDYALWRIPLLHLQRYHIELLLMSIVSLESALMQPVGRTHTHSQPQGLTC